jgi:hypothetical protein
MSQCRKEQGQVRLTLQKQVVAYRIPELDNSILAWDCPRAVTAITNLVLEVCKVVLC